MKRIFEFICIVIIAVGIALHASEKISKERRTQYEECMKMKEYEKFKEDSILKETIKKELSLELDSYMKRYSRKIRLSSDSIIELCIKHNYDISLLMSQAHLESVFGSRTGKTNSVFGLVNRRYSDPNESIEDYIILMKSKYLIERNVDELIESGMKLEKGKGKYAEDPNYSYKIKKLRNNIIENTRIDSLFKKILLI